MSSINKFALHDSPPPEGLGVGVFIASQNDFAEILDVQKKAFISEAELYQNFNIQPLNQTLDEMTVECQGKVVLKAVIGKKIVGSIRANTFEDTCWVSKLVVLPKFQRHGIGGKLLSEIEKHFQDATKFILATGAKSLPNIRLYEKVEYKITSYETFHDGVEAVVMEKERVLSH